MAAYKGVVATADYTFDKTAGTITFSANYTGIALSDIMYGTNVKSAIATVIYDPSNAALGGSLSGLVLTLAYNTSAMADADPLQIIVAMGTLAAKVEAYGTLAEATATRSSAGTFFTQTITNYKWVNVQIDGIVNATLVFETSNNNSIWYFCVLSDVSSTSGVIQANPSADCQYAGPISGKYFRVRTLSYVSGTITVTAEFSTLPTGQNASGVVNGQVGAKLLDHLGNGIDSNSTTYSAKRGLDINVLGTLGTAFSTAGKVDVKAADGDVFVRQATAANLNATVVGTGTFVVQATLAAETTKVIGTVNLSAAQTLATLTSITNVVHVDDNSGSITVDAPVGTPVFARLSDGSAALIGQKAMTASLPVVLASDQSSIPVAATLTAETTKVIGTINVAASQTIAVTNTGTFAVQATPVTQADTFMLGGVNVKEINAVTPLMGSGVMGTGSLRVTIASDNDPLIVKQATAANLNATVVGTGSFVVQATLAAETTKVIGTVNIASAQSIATTNAGTFVVQENGSALTSLQLIDDTVFTDDTSTHSTGTTKGIGIMAVANPTDASVDANDIGMVAMTLARALKNDITTIAGTAPTTAGFIDIKAADGNVFVRQTTASNLNATVVGTGTFAVQATLANETTKVIGTVNNAEGTNNIGYTLGRLVTLSTDVTRQAADTTTYAINDALSNSTSAPTSGGFTFTGAGRASGGSGIISDIIITSMANPALLLAGELWIFNQAVTNINDNAAFGITDGEIKTLVAIVPFTLVDAGNNSYYHAQNLSIGYTCVGTANLRFLVRVKNAYIPVGSEVITFNLKAIQVD